VQKVSVGRVDLEELEAGLTGPTGRAGERLDDAWNLRCVQLGGNRIRGPERNRAGGDRLPAAGLGRNGAAAFPGRLGARLAPGVRQLDAWNRGPAVSRIVRSGPGRRYARPSRCPGRSARCAHAAPPRQPRRSRPPPRHRPASQMHQVPIAGKAILGGILGHGATAIRFEIGRREWSVARRGARWVPCFEYAPNSMSHSTAHFHAIMQWKGTIWLSK